MPPTPNKILPDSPAFSRRVGTESAAVHIILAHGAGAGIDSDTLISLANLLGSDHISVISIEFAYMAARRTGGPKRPPAPVAQLIAEYRSALAHIAQNTRRGQRLFIAGKSLGGRIASLIADDAHVAGLINGAVCVGYPFHAPGKPMLPNAINRTAHLSSMTCPTLILQGERDPFGNRTEIETLALSHQITMTYVSDGDHDLRPRAKSGITHAQNLEMAAKAIAAFCRR